MKIIDPSFEILAFPDPAEMLRLIELAGRTCYKSEPKECKECDGSGMLITKMGMSGYETERCPHCSGSGIEPPDAFISGILKRGHESVIEHASATVRFVTDRGVTHELVRHRLASFSQESTRYANYAKDKFGREITVVAPSWSDLSADRLQWLSEIMLTREHKTFEAHCPAKEAAWLRAMFTAERCYMEMIDAGATAQEARSVLPNSLKTEIVVTANMREWRHVFKLRAIGTTGAPHPDMLRIMVPCLEEFHRRVPVLFEDLVGKMKAVK